MRLRYVLRRLARTPLFTLVAAFTLAAGIGANTTIFTVLNAILLKPLPYQHPEQLVDLNHTAPGVNFPDTYPAPFLYFTYREQGRSFQSIGLYRFTSETVTGLAEPEAAPALNVTAEVLPMLGVKPQLGRWFSVNDDSPGAAPTVILMDGWWRARFGGDSAAIGRNVIVNGVSREIIGVMPGDFRFLDREASFLAPLQLDRNRAFLGQFDFPGIARLKQGITLPQASADLAGLIPIALHSFPPQRGLTVKDFEDTRLAPKLRFLHDLMIGDIAGTLWTLMGTIGILLLIACANVANLLLVRAEARQHELAVRAALGASWRDLARELLAESSALGILGGAIGLGIAYAAIRVLVSLAPASLPRLHDIAIDPAVVAFNFAIALATGILFGFIPVLKYAGPRIADALRGGGRGFSQTRERHRARNMLVVAQVALALVLLVGSGLMIRTFQALRRVDPGFDAHDALTLRLVIPASEVKDPAAVVNMQQSIIDKLRAIPGVTAAGAVTTLPTESGASDLVYARDKQYAKGVPPLRRYKVVSPGLLDAMGQRLVAGRDFTWIDTLERRPVAMVSENLARELWQDPRLAIGKQIRETLASPWREVVGVVKDVRDSGVQQAPPACAYYPLLMADFQAIPVAFRRTVSFVIRTPRAGTPGFLSDVQRAIWSVNAGLPLASVRALQEIVEKSLARTSFTLVMLAIAGAMALLIGLVGIYGVISYTVTQRTREIGIRIALGARPGELTRLFLTQALTLAAIGVACGLACASALTRLLGSLLFGVSPVDPLTYTAVSVVLIIACALASYLPALRAASVDPLESLRQ